MCIAALEEENVIKICDLDKGRSLMPAVCVANPTLKLVV
jgi:hypothetical protein